MLALIGRLLFACCLLSTGARADDAATKARATVHDAGLEGTWSVACREPPARVRRIRWVVPDDGPVQQWVDEGDGFELRGTVRSFVARPDGSATISVEALRGWSWVGTVVHVGEQIRETDVTNTRFGHEYPSVRDGRFTGRDADTPLVEKCDEPDPAVS